MFNHFKFRSGDSGQKRQAGNQNNGALVIMNSNFAQNSATNGGVMIFGTEEI